MNKEKIGFFLILLSFLVLGFLIGRGIGMAQCNKHYQSEEVQEDIYENYVRGHKEIAEEQNFFGLNISI